jgi:hypothetical protein
MPPAAKSRDQKQPNTERKRRHCVHSAAIYIIHKSATH